MAEQPDFWPFLAPKSDPDFEVRERWRHALLLVGAASLAMSDRKALDRWARTPAATPADLFTMLYYDKKDARSIWNEAVELLAEKGLIDDVAG